MRDSGKGNLRVEVFWIGRDDAHTFMPIHSSPDRTATASATSPTIKPTVAASPCSLPHRRWQCVSVDYIRYGFGTFADLRCRLPSRLTVAVEFGACRLDSLVEMMPLQFHASLAYVVG